MNTSYRGIFDINTQVRRLGIVSILIKSLGTEALSEKNLFQRTYRWVKTPEVEKSFSEQTGKIVISGKEKPSATKRYLQLALSLKLLVNVTGMYRNTQTGKVFFHFVENKQVLELQVAEKLLHWYMLLMYDSDVLLTVLKQLHTAPDSSLTLFQKGFQNQHIDHLRARIDISSNPSVKQDLLQKIQQIEREWTNPVKYAEHIVPPRINWLIDLGLAVSQNKSYRLTEGGEIWTGSLLESLRTSDADFPRGWSSMRYFSLCQTAKWPLESAPGVVSNDIDLLSNQIKQACGIYKRSLVKRIPLHQILLHTAVSCLAEKRIAFDLSKIQEVLQKDFFLDENKKKPLLVHLSPRTNEEYILVP